jgi:hypothetical protein
MRKVFWSVTVIALLSGAAYSAAAQQTKAPSTDEMLKTYRNDLQGVRADVLAKNITLTPDQAAKFWPAYAKFSAEQSAIVDEQMKGVQKYADTYASLDDAGATSLVSALLARDTQMAALRTKWLAEFSKIVPARVAARAIQIDRRLGLAHQMSISAQIPLVY